MGTISRLAVLECGEVAARVFNAVGELNHSTDGPPITTVLFHREADAQPWYCRDADEVHALPVDADRCSADDIVACLQTAHIDTVWLGEWSPCTPWGLIAACEKAQIGVVGPDAATVRKLSDLRNLDTYRSAEASLASSAPNRRVELDVLADRHGTVWVLGGRDVSVGPKGKPLVCEAPYAAAETRLEGRIRGVAAEIARSVRYAGAGVVHFVHNGRNFAVTGFDTVASPIHATTEERSGTSIIGWRLRIHRGEALPAHEPEQTGCAFEARLLAEVPEGASAISGVRVALLSFPVGTGVRIDASRRPGDKVYMSDPLLGVVTAWGPDRKVAFGRLRRALQRTTIVLEGAASNRTLLLELLDRNDLERGDIDERWLDRVLAERSQPAPEVIVLLAAAAEAYEVDRALAQEAFYAGAARGRPEQPGQLGRIELSYCGASYALEVARVDARSYSIRHGDKTADIAIDVVDAFERRVTCRGHRHRLLVDRAGSAFRIEAGGRRHVVERGDGAVVCAGLPALVVAILVAQGAHVAAGDPLAVLESMKMETTVTSPMAGEVVALCTSPNAQVDAASPLLRLRARRAHAGAAAVAKVLDLSGLEQPVDRTRKPCARVYATLGNYLLGYDFEAQALRKALTEQRRIAEISEPGDASLVACEDGLLDIYADLGVLYRPQTETEADEAAVHRESTEEHFVSFLQWLDADRAGLPVDYRARLQEALGRFGVSGLERTPALESALMWLFRSFARLGELNPVITAILQRRIAHRDELAARMDSAARDRLDRLVAATQGRQQAIADLAHDVRFHFFDEPRIETAAAELRTEMAEHLAHLAAQPESADRAKRIERLVWCPEPIYTLLLESWRAAGGRSNALRRLVLEVHIRRFYRIARFGDIAVMGNGEFAHATTNYMLDGESVHLIVGYLALQDLPGWSRALAAYLKRVPAERPVVVDLAAWRDGERQEIGEAVAEVSRILASCSFGRPLQRIDVALTSAAAPHAEHLRTHNVTFEQRSDDAFVENALYRDVHPMLARRLEMWRLANFELERRPSPEDVYLFLGVAHSNREDRRLFALAEVRDLGGSLDPASGAISYLRLDRTALQAMAAMRSELARYASRDRPVANRLVIDVSAPWTVPHDHVDRLAHHWAPFATRAGLEKVVLKVRIPDERQPDGLRQAVLHFENVGHTCLVSERPAGREPVRPLGAYQQKVLTAARFGSPYPYEIARLLTQRSTGNGLAPDTFRELDLDHTGQLVPVDREPGTNTAHVVVGLMTKHTDLIPEGMQRIALLSDPTQGLGNLAEPECRRINAALRYALEHRVPVEWFAVSSGALIAMNSGTENMDWIARTLRALIEFTQAGGEINIVVTGINVGGQPYWNSEATMLMHTKGVLIMTPASAMVLTGKQALDFSGAVSAEDNFGIGGYDRIMGPNGQAQYWAPSFPAACALLMRHYELTYVVPGERFPRRQRTSDPFDRDMRESPHAELVGCPFRTVGDIFSPELNPERKQPFDMRSVMCAVADADSEALERWKDLRHGDTSIVWDTAIGGIPVCLLGIEAHNVPRKGFVPADGPPAWTSGTLFPHASRKTARAINAASGNRPLVVLANLSGFDGSPESMRQRQLEYGAEIGRAVTNFRGPIVFVVVSRYHGGAFVVFSKSLNESMEIAAVEGSVASVIGGAPAAATVFVREVKQRTDNDPRVREARAALEAAIGANAARLRAALVAVTEQVRSEKLGEVAGEFDAVHTVERALRVGSIDRIIRARDVRSYVIDALERGMARFR